MAGTRLDGLSPCQMHDACSVGHVRPRPDGHRQVQRSRRVLPDRGPAPTGRGTMNTQRAIATTKRFAAGFRRFRYVVLWTSLAALLCKPVVLMGISGYQRFISPYKGWHCAHAVLHGGASCSAYGKEAVSRHGVLRGGLLLWKRFGDCQQAADTLAANSVGDEVGKQCAAACQKSEKNCADGCARGCTGCPSRITPKSSSTQSTTTSAAPSTFVQPCPDAGGYRRSGCSGSHPSRPGL